MKCSKRVRRTAPATLVCCAVVIGPALAVADNARDAKREVAGLWNVDKLTSTAADNIARRYNLNEFQRDQTHRMMSERVSGFLNEHEEIWPLVRDLYRYQIDGKMPDGDTARQIGQSALPLLVDVKEAILSANMEWREILSDGQKKLHDYDLNDLHRTFGKMEGNFSKMVQGEPVNPGVFPPANKRPPQPNRPRRPVEEFKPPLNPTKTESEKLQEDWWGQYVEQFIRDHDLNEAQSVTCFSILSQCKQRAADYRRSKQKEFKLAQMRLNEARQPGQPAQMREVYKQVHDKLNAPVLEIFEELKTRLAKIPTDAQRQKARASGKVYKYPTQTESQPKQPAPAAGTDAAGKTDAVEPSPGSGPAKVDTAAPKDAQPVKSGTGKKK